MMKLILSFTLLWILSSTAGALQCQGTNCTANEYCVAFAKKNSTGTQQMKSCISSSVCKLSQNYTFSFNFGFSPVTIFLECCNTTKCNRDVAVPGAQMENSLQCYTCDNGVCNKSVKCEGVQDRCIKGSVADGNNMTKVLGCASQNLCDPKSELSYLSTHLNFTTAQKCCKTSFCNSAWTVKPSVVPFLLGLILLVACTKSQA